MSLTLAALLGACSSGGVSGAPVDLPEQLYMEGADQILPSAVVGEAYAAFPEVGGGTSPYTWTVVQGAGTIPGGLVLEPDGQITGIATQAGLAQFPVVASDSAGRSKQMLLTIDVILEPLVVACGESLDGSFTKNIVTGAGPDLNQLDDLAWIGVALPDDLTQRIEFVFDNTTVTTLYVERPSEELGSWAIDEHYVGYYLNPDVNDTRVEIDAGTVPSLSGYATQSLLPLLLASQGAGTWHLDVVCTDGPIIEQLPQYPTELGTEIEIDYDVWGSDEGVRIYTEDPLPEWMIWDEETGEVSGIAEAAGAWEFTVVAEAADGRIREETSIIGVYEVHPVQCGEPAALPVQVEESYYDGEYYGYWDPRGYQVYRLDLSGVTPSSVDLTLSGSDGHYLGLANPEPDWLKFYAGAERVNASGFDAEMVIDPRSYPAVKHYVDDEQMYVIAGSTGTVFDMWLTVECDVAPRANMGGLPVVEPLIPADFPLTAIGGEAPYTWSAVGLPTGLAIEDDRLTGTTSALGQFSVDLTVSDKFGASSTDTYTLYSSVDQACVGATRLECGDSVDGTFTSAYFSDDSGPASTEVFCLVNREEQALGWEVYADDSDLRVDVADPGATADELLRTNKATYVAYIDHGSSDAVSMNAFSWPDLDDYQDLPVFVAVRAYVPGDWTVHLTCD